MKTNSYTASSFLNHKTVTFEIPIYQRLFVWDKIQIDTLLNDLYEAFTNNKENEYYIGIMTAVKKKDEEDIWEMVDGQQRLSFLTLLGTKFLEIDTQTQWKNFLNTQEIGQRIKYIGRDEDQKDIETLTNNDKNEISNAHFKIFLKCFDKFKERKKDLKEFSKYVFEKAIFLISWLNSDYSPKDLNEYFEKLNASGKQLEPEEIIKVRYFAIYATQWNNLIDFSKKYEEESNKVDFSKEYEPKYKNILYILEQEINETILKEPTVDKVKSSTRSILSTPVFLLHTLRITLDEESESKISLNPKKLIETFKNNFDTKKVQDFMKYLVTYRKWLDENIIIQAEDGFKFQKHNKDNIDDNIETTNEKPMRQFQSMLTVSSSETQEWVLTAYQNSKERLTLEDLKSQDKKRQLDITEFNYHSINRYWFWKLDYILWEMEQNGNLLKLLNSPTQDYGNQININFDEEELKKIKDYKFLPNRSIEHLHPQTSDKSWKNEVLHSFGNLAMISSSFNSRQSNDTVAVKFARVKDSDKLESIKMLLMFKMAKGEDKHWTPELAEKHGEQMIGLLKSYH